MPATTAPSLYSDYKAAVSHERFTMDTPVYVQRDNANASAAEAWQANAELREALRWMVEGYEADCFCRNVKPESVLHNHTWLALAYQSAVKLLARKPA